MSTFTSASKTGANYKDMDDKNNRVVALTDALSQASLALPPKDSNKTDTKTRDKEASPPASTVARRSSSDAKLGKNTPASSTRDETSVKPTESSSAPKGSSNAGGDNADSRQQAAPADEKKMSVKERLSANRAANRTPSVTSGTAPAQTPSSASRIQMDGIPSGASTSATPVAIDPANTNLIGGVQKVAGGYRIAGTNIGAAANEPKITEEEHAALAKLKMVVLRHTPMTETRRSIPDPEGRYVQVDPEGGVAATENAMLGMIPWNKFFLGTGRVKADERTGHGKMYSDIVMVGIDSTWVLNQWTGLDVIIEGVSESNLDRPPRATNGKPERRLGHDFCRIGLPVTAFGPIISTLKQIGPTIAESFTETGQYYWLNASWGVTGNPAKFVYTDRNGNITMAPKLYDAMRMLNGSGSKCVATLAISMALTGEIKGNKIVASQSKHELSVKIHNVFHIEPVPYRSPPQSSANGFQVSSSILARAKPLESTTSSNLFSRSPNPMFSGGFMDPFSGANPTIGNSAVMGPAPGVDML